MEHSGFGMETLKKAIRFFEAAALPVIVRVPSKEYHHIARACDAGAEGLMLPMVGTPDEVRRIIASMKYHPQGSRGVALQIAHDNYRPGSVADKFGRANERTTFVCQIETAEGVENADAIAAIDGVDLLWVGHFDLSVSLGIPGQFDHPKFTGAIERVVTAARSGGWCPPSSRGSRSTPSASTSSVIPATSGCCMMRWRPRSPDCAPGAERPERRWHRSGWRSRRIFGRATARRSFRISTSRR